MHNMVHERSEEILKGLYKSASFVLQAVAFKQTGSYFCLKKDLREVVSGKDRLILDNFLALKHGKAVAFDKMSEDLFEWSKKVIERR